MVLKLRLSRVSSPTGARRHAPIYNIVLAQSRSARDSLPLEVLGTYNPVPKLPLGFSEQDAEVRSGNVRKQKEIKVDVERARYWLGVGAQPSDTVWRILSMIGLLPPKFLPTGAQQRPSEALKGVRFPTHQPKKASEHSGESPVLEAVKEAEALRESEVKEEATRGRENVA